MTNLKYSKRPEYGLQVEETLMAGDIEGAKHLVRYWWAWSVLESMIKSGLKINPVRSFQVADLGCGCGYGTRILAEGHPQANILGIDADRDALNMARMDYGAEPNVFFGEVQLSDNWHMPLTDKIFDLMVCFDTLEQVKHRDMLLEQMVMSMDPAGIALFTGDLGRMKTDFNPPRAYIHFSSSMLRSTLRRYFDVVETYNHQESFVYIQDINRSIAKAITNGEPPVMGMDLIYCSNPKN